MDLSEEEIKFIWDSVEQIGELSLELDLERFNLVIDYVEKVINYAIEREEI